MARRGIDTERQQAAAIQGALRQIARGDRPLWRVETAPGDGWVIVGLEFLTVSARTHRAAADQARLAIAALLEVAPDAFDVT